MNFKKRKWVASHSDVFREQTLQAFVPAQCRPSVEHMLNNWPSPAVLSKRLVALDASVARVFAKQMESFEGPAYLWADSSVQARVD